MHFHTFSLPVENAKNVCPVLENSFLNAKNDMIENILKACAYIKNVTNPEHRSKGIPLSCAARLLLFSLVLFNYLLYSYKNLIVI